MHQKNPLSNPTTKHTIISTDGTTIYYEISQKQGKHTIIFIHGIGGDLSVWNKERHALENKGFASLAIDLRGHGLSSRPADDEAYTLSHFVEDIRLVIEKEHLHQPTVIGHSFGGMIAMNLVASYPKLCKALILIDSNYKAVSFGSLLAHSPIVHTLATFIADTMPTTHIEEKAQHEKFVGSGEYSPVRITSDIAHTSIKSYLYAWDQALHYNAGNLLKNIVIPTLIIAGAKDTIFPPKSEITLWEKIKSSEIVFVPTGTHISVLNNPNDLVKDIEAFLKKTV